MIASGHSSVGVIIALSVERIVPATTPLWQKALLVFVFSFISHYLTDFIPHGHYTAKIDPNKWWTNYPLMIDLIGFAALFGIIALWQFGFTEPTLLIVVGIAAAQLTDIWDWFIVARGWVPLRGMVKKHRKLHELIHWHSTTDEQGKRHGLPISWIDIWQVGAFFAALYLLLTV